MLASEGRSTLTVPLCLPEYCFFGMANGQARASRESCEGGKPTKSFLRVKVHSRWSPPVWTVPGDGEFVYGFLFGDDDCVASATFVEDGALVGLQVGESINDCERGLEACCILCLPTSRELLLA